MNANQGLATSSSSGIAFAYNAENGDPYHRLGTAVSGYGNIDQMLEASGADFDVQLTELWVVDEYGEMLSVPNKYATTTFDVATEATRVLGVVGNGYEIEQNREAAQFAYDCVGASSGDAIIDTMGLLKNGSEFFTYVRLEPLVLAPSNGAIDTLEMGLAIRTSHDGSVSLCAFPTATRLVCSNSVMTAFTTAQRNEQMVKVRHTKNKDNYKSEAIDVLGISNKVRDSFMSTAIDMMETPATFKNVMKCADYLWPAATQTDPTARALTVDEARKDKLVELWLSPTNAKGFGENLWTAWQTIGEYLDHHRGLDANKRALASMNPESSVTAQKQKAARFLLSV